MKYLLYRHKLVNTLLIYIKNNPERVRFLGDGLDLNEIQIDIHMKWKRPCIFLVGTRTRIPISYFQLTRFWFASKRITKNLRKKEKLKRMEAMKEAQHEIMTRRF